MLPTARLQGRVPDRRHGCPERPTTKGDPFMSRTNMRVRRRTTAAALAALTAGVTLAHASAAQAADPVTEPGDILTAHDSAAFGGPVDKYDPRTGARGTVHSFSDLVTGEDPLQVTSDSHGNVY